VGIARSIYLNGMMGSGKSTVGRLVADRAGDPFVDLDEIIEQQAGMPIRQIFASAGEPAFRARERAAFSVLLDDPTPRVVALGGGTLQSRALRLRALERGIVVTLTAPTAYLAARLSSNEDRPLLDGSQDLAARLAEIGEARSTAYAEAHAVLDTSQAAPSDLAAEVLRIAGRDPIAVALGERSYAVDVAAGGVRDHLARAVESLRPSRVVLVTDENVDGLLPAHLGSLPASFPGLVKVVLPAGEKHKTLASVERILRAAVEAPVDRGALVVAVGGGVVSDIAGLAAALTLRGLRWIAVPTTILSMVDASVGGKTAVDLGAAKNAVGAFHQPSRVLVDPTFCETESPRAFRSGLAEVIKTALLGDAALYRELLAPLGAEKLARDREPKAVTRAIRSSIAVKAGVVSRDERESGERAHLNLGHTVGHALEAEGGFERLMHGEAVALGLVAALRVGVKLGVTPPALASEVEHLLARLELPVNLDEEPLQQALRWVAYDKKRQGDAIRMILLRAPGSVEITRIASGQLSQLLTAP
jgi:shikimate kinase/3-dehydroquinate synthase